MNENKKTIIYASIAVVLLILAIFSSPGRITPEAFLDQGDMFFPGFTDPNEATTLEVMDFDEATGTARPFKVTFKNNRWTIPSHNDYPADAKDRLARTAAGVIDIKKDEFRTDKVSEHELCGVVDPLDETAGTSGRGQRITIKGESDVVLADIIVGKEIEMRRNYRYVRIPGQNRVYSAQMDIDLSTSFQDWIETDLLKLTKNKIESVVLKDYSINERTLSVESRDNVFLSLKDGVWSTKSGKVDSTATDSLLSSLEALSIVGVRPKPDGLSANLKVNSDKTDLTQNDVMSLRNKGFYLSRDGQLLSNEGELQVMTSDGIMYTLRFGEVVYGSGLAVSAGGDQNTQRGNKESGENRYLFITADFNNDYFTEPPKPSDTAFRSKNEKDFTAADRTNKERGEVHDRWASKVMAGRQLAAELSNRFADWYYVISAESYDKIHLTRSDLVN